MESITGGKGHGLKGATELDYTVVVHFCQGTIYNRALPTMGIQSWTGQASGMVLLIWHLGGKSKRR